MSGGGEVLSSEGTTQDDPVGMAMYALAVIPLISKLLELHENGMVADDATAASTCQQLRTWWDDLLVHGPSFGYYPKASKTFLVVKKEYAEEAESAFAGTSVNITTHGKRHHDATVESVVFRDKFVSGMVRSWSCCHK